MSDFKIERLDEETQYTEYRFREYNGYRCAIRESAISPIPAIWLGVENRDARLMLLTREQVAALIPLLQTFVETGELPK